MSGDSSFSELIRRVRAGDPDAAAELVRRYEPAIRRAVRIRLRDPRLRRLLDSSDLCQSVLASFFARAALGQYELGTPEQLVKLLAAMARNKLANAVHRQQAARRDYRRVEEFNAEQREGPSTDLSPSQQAALRELVQKCQERLSSEERQLAELRSQGLDWDAIAAHLGGSAEALRKRHARTLDRVARELGLEEPSHE